MYVYAQRVYPVSYYLPQVTFGLAALAHSRPAGAGGGRTGA